MADTTSTPLPPMHTRRPFPLNLTLATVLTLAGSVCLWLAGFSTPFIKRIYYLEITQGGVKTKYGAFGYCNDGEAQCSPKSVGWIAAVSTPFGASQYIRDLMPHSEDLTRSFILTPIAAGVAVIAAVYLVVSWFRQRRGTSAEEGLPAKSRLGAFVGYFLCFLLTLIATIFAVLSFILALVAFVIAHHRAKDMDLSPRYGSALWLHMTGAILLLLALPFVLLAWLRHRKNARQTAVTTTTTSYRP